MSNGQIYSVPFKCRDYPDYLRALEVAELLNKTNSDFPITVVLGSGPKDPKILGVRYVDVQCGSSAKIQHFMEMGAELDMDIRELEAVHKLKDPVFNSAPNPFGNDLFTDLFGGTSSDPALQARLAEYQKMLKKLRDENKGP